MFCIFNFIISLSSIGSGVIIVQTTNGSNRSIAPLMKISFFQVNIYRYYLTFFYEYQSP